MTLKTRRQAAQEALKLSPCPAEQRRDGQGEGRARGGRPTSASEAAAGGGLAVGPRWRLEGVTLRIADFTCAHVPGVPGHPLFSHPFLCWIIFSYSPYLHRLSSNKDDVFSVRIKEVRRGKGSIPGLLVPSPPV